MEASSFYFIDQAVLESVLTQSQRNITHPPLLYGCLCAGAMIQNEREMPWHYIVEA